MKPIPNYSRYMAGEDGFLYSTRYKNSNKTVRLKPSLDGSGYLRTMLQRDSDGKIHTIKVHTAICTAYHGASSGKQVNHKNGIKTDNRPDNLEWVTISANIKHAYQMGLMERKRGSLNGNSTLTEIQVKQIRDHAKAMGRHYGRAALAKTYGISEGQVKDIITRRRNIWPHV